MTIGRSVGGRRCGGWSSTDLLGVICCVVMMACIAPMAAGSWRQGARGTGCAQNLRLIMQGLNAYTDDHRVLPPSYVYGSSPGGGGWHIEDQSHSNPSPGNGYVHWSWTLVEGGHVAEEAIFRCPDALRGGAPRTNPGPVAENWESGQVNDLGASAPSALPMDRQVSRLSYTANAALLPRNRFSTPDVRRSELVPAGGRVVRPGESGQVSPTMVREPSGTIAGTEWLFTSSNGWRALAVTTGGGEVYKSHRPVTPFVGVSAGTSVYDEPDVGNFPRFAYPNVNEIVPAASVGIDFYNSGLTELNLVGRHHAGGGANFSYLDEHVELSTVQETITQRKWGGRFYSMSGGDLVSGACR